jgi:hypothetical protein
MPLLTLHAETESELGYALAYASQETEMLKILP